MLTNNQQKIRQIQEKKKKLKDRIQKLNTETLSQISDSTQSRLVLPTYEEKMTQLMQKKKKIEQQKEKEFRFKKMQDQYIERTKQVQRQKRLQQIKNQKRMIQLEAGMKRIVFEGVKQKVKGANSEQLMMRAMLRDQHQGRKPRGYTSKGNVRRDFQKFLQTQEQRNIKQKWDIYELNEKRFQIFQKKEETFMRQVLLKQLILQGKDQDVDVLSMNRSQLENKLEQYGLSLEDYIQNIPKKQMVQAIPQIQKNSLIRIQQYKNNKQAQDANQRQYQKIKRKLKQDLLLMQPDHVKFMKALVFSIIDDTVFDYQKRLNRFQVSQIPSVKQGLQQRYKSIMLESQNYQYSKIITLKLLERVHEQFFIEAAQQMTKLHDLSHDKTEQAFAWMFKKGSDIAKKFNDIKQLNIPLEFQSQNNIQQPVKKPQRQELQKQNYLNNFEDYTNNIFDVDKLTTQLINQINLIRTENEYFDKITIKIFNEKEAPQEPFHIIFDRQLYLVTNESVFNSRKTKKLQPIGINSSLQMISCSKFHNFWIIHDSQKVSLYSAWGLQILKNEIGERMGTISGKITCFSIFPIFSFLGGICSLLLGFQKGQVLKYNFNLNRINNSQTNLSIYTPLLPQIKTGDEPPFPSTKKKTIPVQNKKVTAQDQLHEFRQFFDHHTAPIIGILCHKYNSFITVDKTLKCAIWFYDEKQGAKCYKPAYTFQLVCSYNVYKQAEDSRYKQIYPGGKLKESGQLLYEKWIQTEGFLKKQIYNDSKNKKAYYRTLDNVESGDIPLWKIAYSHQTKTIKTIHESYYTAIQGKMIGKSAKLWRQYLLVLCQRDHPIRKDLKSIKIYGWDIQERKMRSIGIQLDVYSKQTHVQFQVLDNMLSGVDMHLLAAVSSGRILIFSMLSGQLLRSISDPQYLQNPKYKNAYFTQIAVKKALLAAVTKSFTAQITFNDRNQHQDQKQMNKIIEDATKKYINLL